MPRNEAKGTKNNRMNPYLDDATFERLEAMRWERRMGWGELLEWGLPILEKAHAAEQKAAKAKAVKAKKPTKA